MLPAPFRWRLALVVLGLGLVAVTSQLDAQRRSFSTADLAKPEDYRGEFQFCRVAFGSSGGRGSSWSVDSPRADINLSTRLSELSMTPIVRTPDGTPHWLLVRLTDPELFLCPFIMMTEVGSAYLQPEEADRLREYLLKGGFLWADDFWGTAAWEGWAEQLNEVLPSAEYPVVDLDPSHPLFHAQFSVKETPQIASIQHWSTTGGTSERGADSEEVHTRAVLNRQGHIMVLMTHNTDVGDSFEREADDPTYFQLFSVPGYAFGINTLLYALSH